MRFVNAELLRLGLEPIGMERVVDTLALARKKHPGQQNSLDALCDRYRIDRTKRLKHGALLDAEILVEIYGELTGGRQRSLSFDDRRETGPSTAGQAARPLAPRPPRRARLMPEEAVAHGTHIAMLGESAVWRLYQGSDVLRTGS
jgi:DNA polymerase-3 subunit epsilon